MKDEQNKDSNYSTLSTIMIVFVALVILSIVCCYIYTLEKLGTSNYNINDAFTGTALTIIGILVTFVIGYQIFNAIELKKDIDRKLKPALSLQEELLELKRKSEQNYYDNETDKQYQNFCDKKLVRSKNEALYYILKCIESRIKLEEYIDKYVTEEYESISIINYIKLSAYEFIFIDFICHLFIGNILIKGDSLTFYPLNSINIKDILKLLEKEKSDINIDSFNKVHKILNTYNIEEDEYLYKKEIINDLFKYRNSYYEINKDYIQYLKNDIEPSISLIETTSEKTKA